MENFFKGKIVVITGSSRGIGFGIAQAFINREAKVIITGTKKENLTKAENLLQKKNLASYILNVADAENVKEVFDDIIKKYLTIDILVNNAGITQDTLVMRMSENQWDQVLNINLKGAFLCSKSVLRPMVKARYGKIINLSSVVGVMGNVGQANYASSKAGLLGLTKSMAKELASRNICVNAVAPGFIKSEMTDAMSEQAIEEILRNVPMQRMGTIDDVAEVVLFLASSKADYITGEVININGGLVMS